MPETTENTQALIPRQEQAFSLVPKTLAEALQFGKLLADSDLVPKDYKGKPANVVVAIQMGLELGLPPMQAIQNIAVINGRPCLWGDGFFALINAAPEVADVVEHVNGQGDARSATCKIVLRDREPVIRSFSVADAKKAGLWGKSGPWQSYPDRMLQMRARGFAGRDALPHRLKGIQLAEEVTDIPQERPQPSEPRRVGEGRTTSPSTESSDDRAPAGESARAETPASASPPSQASASPSANGAHIESGAMVTDTTYVPAQQGNAEHWTISTTRGAYKTRDQQLVKVAEELEGTHQRCTIAWVGGKTATGERIRVLRDLVEDVPDEETEQRVAEQGDLREEGVKS